MGTFVFASQLISLFRNDPDVVAFGVVTLRVQSLTIPLSGGAMVTNFMPQTAERCSEPRSWVLVGWA